MEISRSLRLFFRNKNNRFIKNFSSKSNSSLNYCFDSVRKYDFENFLCTILLPGNIKSKAIGLRAFNIELARVQDNVSDPLIGEMRLQFWSDTVDSLYKGTIPEHPVAIQLYKVLEAKKLSKRYFSRLITSRLEFLKKPYFNSLEEMEKYSENSVSSIYYLLLEISGIQDLQTDHAASHLGKSIGIANLMRSQPYLISSKQKMISLPQDVLSKYGISQETVLRARKCNPEFLDKAVYDIASRSWLHLNKARNIKLKQSQVKKIFLPAVPIESYLERLRYAQFDLFNSQLEKRDGLLPLKIYWRKIKGSF